ncbi:alpha/beta hydrolase [Streptomyces sp. BI20]|uniref:alpha/beta hydrolase n=1 Tax=Streptomyces sp. BI20 TaxID=3403460 RepID=UPI003C729076
MRERTPRARRAPRLLPALVLSVALTALTVLPAPPALPLRPDRARAADRPTGDRAAGVALAARRAAARGLSFGPCPEVERLPDPVRCALLSVPRDYAEPDGPRLELTVSRVPASGPRGSRQGALLFNPGGPGGSGMWFPLLAESAAWTSLAAAYDFVGWAPRGVGRSAPLSCRDPLAPPPEPPEADPGLPPTPAETTRRRALATDYARGCAARSGALLPHVTTANNARDLEVLRAALGEPGLNLLGASYGTLLGAVYARMFPDRVRRMVFDSVVDPDPAGLWYGANLAQSRAFEGRVRDLWAWTARHHDVYGLGRTPRAVAARWERIRAELARRPARGPEGVVGPGRARSWLLRAAYEDEEWPDRAAALAAWARGDRGPLLASAAPDPAWAAEDENATAVYTAVLCNDAPWPTDWARWERDLRETAREAPFETWANGWLNAPCATWPVSGREALPEVGDPGGRLPATLLVAAERDGATPYAGALSLRRRLGGRAALVTEREAGAHGVVGGRNACVDGHVARYLLTGRTPGDGPGASVVCAPHPEPAPVSLDDTAAPGPRRGSAPWRVL